jgi:hypothetical protein
MFSHDKVILIWEYQILWNNVIKEEVGTYRLAVDVYNFDWIKPYLLQSIVVKLFFLSFVELFIYLYWNIPLGHSIVLHCS